MQQVFLYLVLIGLCGSLFSMTLMSSITYTLLLGPLIYHKRIASVFKEHRPTFLWGFVWMAWICLGTFIKLPMQQALTELNWAWKILLPLCGLFFTHAKKPKYYDAVFWLLLTLGSSLSFYLCYQQIYILQYLRADGYHHNAVYLALNHGLIISVILCLKLPNNLWALGLYFLNLLLLFGGMLLSGTRTTLIAIPILMLLTLYKQLNLSSLRLSSKMILLAIFSASLLASLSQSTAFQRLYKLKDGIQNESSANARVEIWRTNIDFILQNPILGTGYRANALWADSNAEHLKPFLGVDFGSFFAHNQFLQSMAESGILGFVFLLLYFFYLYRSYPSTFTVFLFLILSGLFDAPLTVSRFVYPFVLCFLVIHVMNQSVKHSADKSRSTA